MGHPGTVVAGTITALYDVGAGVGTIGAASTSKWLGRKRTLILSTTVLIVGMVLMRSVMERVQMMVVRISTGIGTRSITSGNSPCLLIPSTHITPRLPIRHLPPGAPRLGTVS
ncbi:hypothetical protein OBBRIDRAFT_248371 [Obba rivulosa]|uniref:Major facilitator superfamily (MFS) profile domain-containing protein n=1 Tax=Obba rivulosa TaxID=1052685 RepID=A0A8E2DGT4_9APHY|nr:hypothetical protein OBBRIDRAFT_248371 [Obba rivulosa]